MLTAPARDPGTDFESALGGQARRLLGNPVAETRWRLHVQVSRMEP
jgi:hypothetical protein